MTPYAPIYGVSTDWTISATGWGIDNCSVSFPAGVSCGGTATTKTVTLSKTWPTNSRFGTIGIQNFYFDAGAVGDISKITHTVRQNYCTVANDCRSRALTATSGNIQ